MTKDISGFEEMENKAKVATKGTKIS